MPSWGSTNILFSSAGLTTCLSSASNVFSSPGRNHGPSSGIPPRGLIWKNSVESAETIMDETFLISPEGHLWQEHPLGHYSAGG